MEFTGSVWASFSASHVVKGHPLCGRLHGHRWTVTVEIAAEQSPDNGDLASLGELWQAVRGFCDEVDLEDVNAMFPASPPTPAGVAMALRERLALRWGKVLREITVTADFLSATLHA